MIVSHLHFMWFVTGASLLICAIWGAREVYMLCKLLPRSGREKSKDRRQWRDQVFGSVIGVVIIIIGIIGVARFWMKY